MTLGFVIDGHIWVSLDVYDQYNIILSDNHGGVFLVNVQFVLAVGMCVRG